MQLASVRLRKDSLGGSGVALGSPASPNVGNVARLIKTLFQNETIYYTAAYIPILIDTKTEGRGCLPQNLLEPP